MKKAIPVLIIFILAGNFASAAVIDNIENSLFGFTYPNETQELRLNRIEEQVYGKTSTGGAAQRLSKLSKDLAADSIGKEITPKEDTFSEDSGRIAEIPKNAPGVDYPAVNELEQIVFNKEFKEKDLNTRLAELEQKAFKKTYANDDFSTRTDRLRADLKPRSLMDNSIAQSSNNFFDDEPVTLQRDYNLQMYQSPDQFDYNAYNAGKPQKVNLNAVENSVFKRSYPDDNLESRLARLENSMFGATFDNDSQQERMNRISSAHSAQKSAKKYDSNKFAQNLTTGMQIGMFILMVLACIL
ncbi:MAG: hypothetical protein LBK53_05310 [Heliobacteriaceae bacterium]|nr:hypothetical protein [Heliobacteriaceae bacterium]